jgi:hypothetical protein
MSYHQKIQVNFGSDLFKLLGPKSQRVPWNSLSSAEKRKRLGAIPVYVPTRSLGKHPKLIDVVIFCFNKLVNMGVDNPLLGIDLPEYSSLSQAAEVNNVPAMNYDSNTLLKNIDLLYKNAAKQRDVFLRHIFEDIVFRFNPGLIFPGIGRMNSREMLFVNDAQHRILACIILGIEQVPMSFINSDDEYWDVAHYAAINIHSLGASEFDKYRIRVQRQIESVAANYPVDPDDQICYELHELFDNLGITVTEKGDSLGTHSLVLTGIGNMIKYREDYSKNHFERAVTLNAQMFPTSKFHTANSLGLMEFLKHQDPGIDPQVMDYAIMNAIKVRWAKDNIGGQLHSHLKDSYKSATGTAATSSRAEEPLIIAHGIWQVCKKYQPDINWIEPEWNIIESGPKYVFPLID